MAVISYAPSTPDDRIRRRRSLFNDYNKRREAKAAVVPADPEPTAAPRKGVCPVCGKHIGRGVAFHAKRCEG
jgi:hypothetical protein